MSEELQAEDVEQRAVQSQLCREAQRGELPQFRITLTNLLEHGVAFSQLYQTTNFTKLYFLSTFNDVLINFPVSLNSFYNPSQELSAAYSRCDDLEVQLKLQSESYLEKEKVRTQFHILPKYLRG